VSEFSITPPEGIGEIEVGIALPLLNVAPVEYWYLCPVVKPTMVSVPLLGALVPVQLGLVGVTVAVGVVQVIQQAPANTLSIAISTDCPKGTE